MIGVIIGKEKIPTEVETHWRMSCDKEVKLGTMPSQRMLRDC